MSRAALPLLGAALLGAGCLAPQTAPREVFYVLRPERVAPAAEPLGAGALRVARVRMAPLVERTAFVYRTSERTFEADFYHRFAALPGALVREALVPWLTQAGLFAEVQADGAPERARWRLDVRVAALHADLRDAAAPRAVLETEVALVDASSPDQKTRLRERYRAEVPTSADPGALVEAWTRGLAQVLAALEEDLRAALASSADPTAEGGPGPR